MMKKLSLFGCVSALCILLCMSCFAADFVKTNKYNNNFSDVPQNSWYAKNVASVYELGLMEGVTDTKFDVESEMSVAQAITIATRLHSIYNNTTIPEAPSGSRWFQKYVNYAVDNKIMTADQFNSYTRSVLSYEMVMLFAKALPEEHYKAINNITYIQDVPDNLIFHEDVLMFYNAGILNGNDEVGTFLPMSAITRKRASVILSRTALFEDRLTFSLSEKKEVYTGEEVLDILDSQTVKGALDEMLVAEAGDYKVSAGEYRYYASVSNGDKAKIDSQIAYQASLHSLITDENFTLSYEELANILAIYYNSRITNFGSMGYFDAVENQKLTDSVYAKLTAMDEMIYQLIIDETNSMTSDKVFEYALDNNYICAKHILIQNTTEDAYRKALEINLEILDGADFDELLKEYNQDPGMTARQYGYFFGKGRMVAPFEEAAYALEEGEVSGIVESSFGYHIIKRMPMDKEEFSLSPDYANIMYEASSSSVYEKITRLGQSLKINYIESIEDISSLLH